MDQRSHRCDYISDFVKLGFFQWPIAKFTKAILGAPMANVFCVCDMQEVTINSDVPYIDKPAIQNNNMLSCYFRVGLFLRLVQRCNYGCD